MNDLDDRDLIEEVDASAIFKQTNTSGITRVNRLSELLEIFGYAPDDRIDRREICVMYETVKKAMEDEIHRLAHTACYDAAKDMRARLTRLRGEFDNLQVQSVKISHEDQLVKFDIATNTINSKMQQQNLSMQKNSECMLESLKADQLSAHEIQTNNLELELMRIPRPRIKYSKRCIELMKAEHELIRLSQYDDARKVNHMLLRVKPREEARFNQKFDAVLEEKREHLRKEQAKDLIRLDEKLKFLKWRDIRLRDKELQIGLQRLRNHDMDMRHSHLLEKKLRPEMSVKPSALWLKRKNFHSTSASLRGQQLFEQAKGFEQSDDSIFCETLTDKHDFSLPLLSTVQL